MKLKIITNAPKEIARLQRFPRFFRKTHVEALDEMLEIARKRIVDFQIVPDGGVPGKRGGYFYKPARGTTIKRMRNGKPYGGKVFHKSRLVSRSGKYLDVFKKKTSELIMNVKALGGAKLMATFGVQGTQKDKALIHEKGGGNINKVRKPMFKALKWAQKRYFAILVNKNKELKGVFEG